MLIKWASSHTTLSHTLSFWSQTTACGGHTTFDWFTFLYKSSTVKLSPQIRVGKSKLRKKKKLIEEVWETTGPGQFGTMAFRRTCSRQVVNWSMQDALAKLNRTLHYIVLFVIYQNKIVFTSRILTIWNIAFEIHLLE